MKAEDIMTRVVRACRASDSLERAAHIMWEADIGCLPVLDERLHPIAMITDRDIAMAAFFQGLPLRDLRVETAMSRTLTRCRTDTDLLDLEYLMQCSQVRRIPVVTPTGEIAGIVTLADLVRAGSAQPQQRLPGLVRTVLAISERRAPGVLHSAAAE